MNEVERRLDKALRDARYSALGVPSSVETVMAMLLRAGLELKLANSQGAIPKES